MKPTWRKEPPTVDEVKVHQWWWNKPASGNPPHVLQLDVDDGRIFDCAVDVCACTAEALFDPNDWPGEWAPCVPPGDNP